MEQVGEKVDGVKRGVEEVRRAVEEVGKRVDKVKRGSAAWIRGFWPCWRRRKASTKA